MASALDVVPCWVNGTEAARLGADFIVLDATGKTLRGLNAAGARVWQLIDGQRNAEEIAARMASDCDVSIERARVDVLAFLKQLSEKQLVTLRAP